MNQAVGISQLDLGFGIPTEPDRNHEHGGRSFYFFDLDDNVFHLSTQIYIYHRQTGEEVALSTGQFAQIGGSLGKPGAYEHFFVNPDDSVGSFRGFRDHALTAGALQPFVNDIARALEKPDYEWKGPSWDCFHYAVFNQRPVAVITARGHHPETIREGIRKFVAEGFLPAEPNYLEVFPVSHPATRAVLGDVSKACSAAELKKRAIIRCVETAMARFGENPFHRFGMSDDDPHNIRLIVEAKRQLKARYPENSFFVIHADKKPFTKEEVFCDRVQPSEFDTFNQLDLFGARKA